MLHDAPQALTLNRETSVLQEGTRSTSRSGLFSNASHEGPESETLNTFSLRRKPKPVSPELYKETQVCLLSHICRCEYLSTAASKRNNLNRDLCNEALAG